MRQMCVCVSENNFNYNAEKSARGSVHLCTPPVRIVTSKIKKFTRPEIVFLHFVQDVCWDTNLGKLW